jgi:hypothetical protein
VWLGVASEMVFTNETDERAKIDGDQADESTCQEVPRCTLG